MRHTEKTRRLALASLGALVGFWMAGCGSFGTTNNQTARTIIPALDLTIAPSIAQIRAGSTLQLSASSNQQTGTAPGIWIVSGGGSYGVISPSGLYSAPATAPGQPAAVSYSIGAVSATSQITILNPAPTVQALAPSSSSSASTLVTVTGTGFLPSSTLLVNGVEITTQFKDTSHLSGTITVDPSSEATLQIAVSNPDPGAITSSSIPFTFTPSLMTLSPATLATGEFTLSATAVGIQTGSVLSLNGSPLATTSISGSTITASGYLPPWAQGSVQVSVTAPDGTTLAQATEPVTATTASFDTAARFSTQAAWGPRPDVVLHIQQVGLQKFVAEQLATPVGSYDVTTTNPIRSFFLNITSGNSLLRLRTAWAFQTFIPGQIFFADHNKALPWEETLERDAFTNYRQILTDAASDPNITLLLNLSGNAAPSDPNVHPNQNFARELMQLFSIGTVMLNEDGSPKLDASGHMIPAYDDNTVIDMSRVLTGWINAPTVNPWFTCQPFQIDFSQPLVPVESQHDQGPKTLFGTVSVPAGQTATQDRTAAIEAIMNHPNTAPFVSRLLIQRLTESQPSPAYVQRIAQVFKDDGSGVSGNLSAVISAILLDPEARAGDTAPAASNGFLQDPLYQQMFMMSVLQISGEDDQSTYIFNGFSETFWNPGTVFGYFSPSYIVPGTAVNSPEFQLLTNFTDIQRSQFLYSVVLGKQPGFNNGFAGWLYSTFTTLPSMVDALNHLLYHGEMPAAEQASILSYCGSISDHQLQLETAVFLALNGNSYLVSH